MSQKRENKGHRTLPDGSHDSVCDKVVENIFKEGLKIRSQNWARFTTRKLRFFSAVNVSGGSATSHHATILARYDPWTQFFILFLVGVSVALRKYPGRRFAVFVYLFLLSFDTMRAFLAILVVAVTLAVASQTVSAAQYFLTVQYSAAGCSATPGNSWSQATVRPTNSCQIATASGYGSKFECNATHVLEYECTIVDGACQCLLNRGTRHRRKKNPLQNRKKITRSFFRRDSHWLHGWRGNCIL
jgi:hypothetical protein